MHATPDTHSPFRVERNLPLFHDTRIARSMVMVALLFVAAQIAWQGHLSFVAVQHVDLAIYNGTSHIAFVVAALAPAVWLILLPGDFKANRHDWALVLLTYFALANLASNAYSLVLP